jgi:hypothetical protein
MSSNRVMHQVRIFQAVTCARGAWMFAGAQVRYYLPLLAVASGRDELTHADDEFEIALQSSQPLSAHADTAYCPWGSLTEIFAVVPSCSAMHITKQHPNAHSCSNAGWIVCTFVWRHRSKDAKASDCFRIATASVLRCALLL